MLKSLKMFFFTLSIKSIKVLYVIVKANNNIHGMIMNILFYLFLILYEYKKLFFN